MLGGFCCLLHSCTRACRSRVGNLVGLIDLAVQGFRFESMARTAMYFNT